MIFHSTVGEMEVVVEADYMPGQRLIIYPPEKAQPAIEDTADIVSVTSNAGEEIVDDLSDDCVKRFIEEALNIVHAEYYDYD